MYMDKIIDKYNEYDESINNVLSDLEGIILDDTNFEGNCFYFNKTFIRKKELFNKQLNLFWIGTENHSNICEIGFNAGHSTLLLLLSNNKNINFTIFDINTHSYTEKCFEYIKNKFVDVNFEFVSLGLLLNLFTNVDLIVSLTMLKTPFLFLSNSVL